MITCGGCPSTWTALGAAHCSACHRTFSNVGLFDLLSLPDDELIVETYLGPYAMRNCQEVTE